MLAQDDRLATRVGTITLLLVLAGIAIAIFVLPEMKNRDVRRIRVYFHHGGGLREGAPLVVAGREVGIVESIRSNLVRPQAGGSAPRGTTPLGNTDGIEVVVAIELDTAALISRGGDVFVASRGPLGDKFLEIAPSPDPGKPYAENEQVLGRDPPQMDRVMNRTWENLQTAKAFVDELRPEWEAFMVQMKKLPGNAEGVIPVELRNGVLAQQVDELIAEFRQLRDGALGGEAGLARLSAMIANGRRLLAETRVRISELQATVQTMMTGVDDVRARIDKKGIETLAAIDRAIERAKAAIDKIDPLLANVQAINDRLARGEGSLGRLMRDPEFPEDAKELGKILKREPWKIFSRPPK